MDSGKTNAKSLRKRLQRQLEFYLSASNLRQDKFLQQHADADGLLPASLFLAFNKMMAMRATEKLVLEAAHKSDIIRVDDASARIGPADARAWEEVDEQDVDERTIYVEGFDVHTTEHDVLRKAFMAFGKVQLVSMPRFSNSRKFKGFAFIEFSTREVALAALDGVKTATVEGEGGQNEALKAMKAMPKMQWVEMKEKLKEQLQKNSEKLHGMTEEAEKPKEEAIQAVSGHVRFREEDEDEDSDAASKKQRVEL